MVDFDTQFILAFSIAHPHSFRLYIHRASDNYDGEHDVDTSRHSLSPFEPDMNQVVVRKTSRKQIHLTLSLQHAEAES